MRHFAVLKTKNRSDYEPLWDKHHGRCDTHRWSGEERRQFRITGWCCLMVAVYVAVTRLFADYRHHHHGNNRHPAVSSHHPQPQHESRPNVTTTFLPPLPPPRETVPTLLAVRDPVTHAYVSAWDNPVYRELERSVRQGSRSRGSLRLPRTREAVTTAIHVTTGPHRGNDNHDDDDDVRDPADGTSLKVHWTATATEGADPTLAVVTHEIYRDDDILVLQCGESERTLRVLEAATLAQLQAMIPPPVTIDNQNTWTIPSIPSAILRQPFCQFVVYQKLVPPKPRPQPEYYVVAASDLIQWGAVTKPTAVHLALTEHVDRVLVQFVTGAMGTPVAQYGRQPTATTMQQSQSQLPLSHHPAATATGTTDTYAATDLCQAPANETGPGKFLSPGYLHTVALTGLAANTVYYYKVGLETGQGVTWSSRYRFTTALPAGDSTEHTYVVYGDQGCPETGWGEGSVWVQAMAERESNLRSIHHVGDLSYAQGAAHQWDAWLDMMQPVAAQVPLMIAVGNHEYDHDSGGGGSKDPSHVETDSGFMPTWGNFGNDSGGECGVPTAKRFTMPATGNGVFWYSYDYGLVHTVVISSEHDLSTGSPQHAWLELDLLAVNRSTTPWLIVESHRPFYEGECCWEDNSVGVAMRLEMEDLLFDYSVDVVIAGHYHAYHRTYVWTTYEKILVHAIFFCSSHCYLCALLSLLTFSPSYVQLRWPLS